MAQKSTELEQYLQRVHELEDMYHQLEDALEEERRARQDEETVRKLQARSVTRWRREDVLDIQKISSRSIRSVSILTDTAGTTSKTNSWFTAELLFSLCPKSLVMNLFCFLVGVS